MSVVMRGAVVAGGSAVEVQSVAASAKLVARPAVSWANWAMPVMVAMLATQGRPETPAQPAAAGEDRHRIGGAADRPRVAPGRDVARVVAVLVG